MPIRRLGVATQGILIMYETQPPTLSSVISTGGSLRPEWRNLFSSVVYIEISPLRASYYGRNDNPVLA